MVKYQGLAFALVLLLATALAAGTQRRLLRTRQLARQEAGGVTPYPSADEIKPEIPFDEAAAAQTPDEVYGPPDVFLTNVPDEIYGPPLVDGNSLPPAVDEVTGEELAPEIIPVPAEEQSSRLAVARRIQRQRVAAYRRAAQLRNSPYLQRRRI